MNIKTMKMLLGYWILCIFLVKVRSSPQITKLFPVKELAEFHERTNEIKPLDKLFGKLRATYNFVFNKAEDTSNVEKILAKDAPNPDLETLKLIWENVIGPKAKIAINNDKKEDIESKGGQEEVIEGMDVKENVIPIMSDALKVSEKTENDDWLDGVEAPKSSSGLELQDDSDDDDFVETTTPNASQLPIALARQLLDWLGALLGLTYGAYTRVAQAVKC